MNNEVKKYELLLLTSESCYENSVELIAEALVDFNIESVKNEFLKENKNKKKDFYLNIDYFNIWLIKKKYINELKYKEWGQMRNDLSKMYLEEIPKKTHCGKMHIPY